MEPEITVGPYFIIIRRRIENLGPLNGSGLDFLSKVGRRLSASSQDPPETSFLFHRLSVLIQRYNSVLICKACNVSIQAESEAPSDLLVDLRVRAQQFKVATSWTRNFKIVNCYILSN